MHLSWKVTAVRKRLHSTSSTCCYWASRQSTTVTDADRKTSKMMRLDLERAGVPYVDAEGHVADFHANRHTFITNLCRAGVAPKVAQSLARHSTITLTMDVYSHADLSEWVEAVRSLPAPPQLQRCISPPKF